ncbi:MAG TPA: peptidase S8 [Rheinheimera sp.]|nr:peptidase S8 [Rheinheimera sp.]
MFNRRPLSVLLASALYTVGTANALASPAGTVQQVQMAELQKYASQRAGTQANQQQVTRQGRPGGLNQQVRPASTRAKFIEEAPRSGKDVYIVRLRDLPVATYDGRLKGLDATASSLVAEQEQQASGFSKLLNQSASRLGMTTDAQRRVESYKEYLTDKQDQVLTQISNQGIDADVRVRFQDALNGFSLQLTQAEAKAIAALPEVEFVQRSEMLRIQSDRGPSFIGADKVWQGQTPTGVPYQGEGMVVGILDTGINSDHPSFAPVGADGYEVQNPLGEGKYLGDCVKGTVTCNSKLIGVWSWPVITNDFAGIRPPSGEDYNGHGSHTAGTAAGNVMFNVPLQGASLGDGDGINTGFFFPRVSGVAPHANIIAYQVCIPDGGCPTEAVVKAIDQAIADGVDVINFSIGGAEDFPWEDATELAFLSAREAGISLSASAGNFGSAFYTLGHSAPWSMVVAASTHDRVLDVAKRQLELTGGATTPPDFPLQSYTNIGGMSASGVTGTLVNAADKGDELCAEPFAAGTFTADQIVVCKRGTVARVQKAYNVLAGGAGGFVLVNAGYPSDNDDIINDTYPLPGVQLQSWDGQALLAWMADGGSDHAMSIPASQISATIDASKGDILADFSSRGPSATYLGHLVPDITGPGVDIFAPFADEHPFNPGSALSQDWGILSGTSMSSPHVAGAMTLVRQAHPSWTPAEVQSALVMSAAETVRRDVTEWNSAGFPARQYRAGAGRVDVKAAIDAGLVMDETAANFLMANPRNGGDVKQLNLPQLVNNNCRDICTWTRTVKATRDGSWSVSTDPVMFDRWSTFEGEIAVNGVKIDVQPASFNLKAGQTQVVTIRADLTDSQFRRDARLHVNSNEEIELWSNVRFTPQQEGMSVAHWPVSINFDKGPLPKNLNVTVNRDQGAYRLNDAALPAMSKVTYRGFGPVKADIQTLTLPQDIDHIPFIDDNDLSHGNVQFQFINVPENTARLVTEVLENSATTSQEAWRRGWMTIYVGRDSNGNGKADPAEELLCQSNTEIELNYCSITHPDAGSYWIAYSNVRTGSGDFEEIDIQDSYKIATAVVPQSANALTVQGPASTDGTPVTIDLGWNINNFETGDVAYAGFDVGPETAPGKVGFVPVKLTRGLDDVTMAVSQTRARGGDVVDVSVHVEANNSGADRTLDLTAALPAGLTLVPGSVDVSQAVMAKQLTVQNNTISLKGVQKNSEFWPRDYIITDSRTDAMCRTPVYSSQAGSSQGGFVGLVKTLGLTPDFGGSAVEWTDSRFTIPLNYFWDKGLALYNNDANQTYPELKVSPQGWVALDPWVGMPLFHQKFPFFSSPYTPMIGVMWKGTMLEFTWDQQRISTLGTPLNVVWGDNAATSGMVIGHAANTDDLIIEWVNARSEQFTATWNGITKDGESADRYNFDLILNPRNRFADGKYELIMAYGDVDFAGDAGTGSIGIHGHYGALDIFGYPWQFEGGKGYAYNDLKDKLQKDLVVCYDYTGPEATAFDINFQVRVAETAAGKDLAVTLQSAVSGMGSRTLSQPLAVAGNLKVYPINDQTVVENTTLKGIAVQYHDAEGLPNVISVSGANVTAVVNGSESGATIDLTPGKNFEGETTVTVTVADKLNSADQASTSFKLKVTPGVNIVDPEPAKPVEVVKKSGGSSSVPMLALLAAVAVWRRRRMH